MSVISVSGTLILNGDIYTDSEVRIESTGLLVPIARDLTETIFSCPVKDLKSYNGKSPTIKTSSNIHILGTVDALGRGFPANQGPGANSRLISSQEDPSIIYGANHAGVGTVTSVPGTFDLVQEDIRVTGLHIDQGGIDLKFVPISDVAMNVVNGPSQLMGTDFILLGDFIRWTGLGLDGIIAEEDIVRFFYFSDTNMMYPPPLPTYGSYLGPTSLGSGSGETNGGGGLRLIAPEGLVNLNGYINLNGQSGVSRRSGGASGGSLWAISKNLSGGGVILAEGGDATYVYAGGGGGGYITLNYDRKSTFQGYMSVKGRRGASKGLITVQELDPFFQDKFTGTILNKKWWNVTQKPVVLNNEVQMDTTAGDIRNPQLDSLFNIYGKDIKTDCDFIPSGIEAQYYSAYFKLAIDATNWVGVTRKYNHVFGSFSIDGTLSQTAIPYDNTSSIFRIEKFDSTYSFQFIDSSRGVVDIFSNVIPEFKNVTFKAQLGIQKYPTALSIIDSFKLTEKDVTNGFVTLPTLPSDASLVALSVVGGPTPVYGVDYSVAGQNLYWTPLYLQTSDQISVQYPNDTSFNDVSAAWDNFAVWTGILNGVETRDPVIFVDAVNGSDMSSGGALTPLKNLFVATAWAKKGGTVVLYDGTYNPTEINEKNLIIQGAYGARPLITTANVQNSRGSHWEENCLTFRNSQSLVRNINFKRAQTGIYANSALNFEVSNCDISDVSSAILYDAYSLNCKALGNTIHDASIGVSFDGQAISPNIYSNVIYNTQIGAQLNDASNFIVGSNTFDSNGTCLEIDTTSIGVVVSNNMTFGNLALMLNGDSSVSILNNNFYLTTTVYTGVGTVLDYIGNIIAQPLYVNQAARNYHVQALSADRSSGTDLFDNYYVDRDGARRFLVPGYDIGAYQYINVPHPSGGYYADTSGDDFRNYGTIYSPYRTFEKAMSSATAPVYMSSPINRDASGNAVSTGGHYDFRHVNLKEQNIYFVDASKSVQTFTLDSNYSNINLKALLFVSPNGSDSTLMGGDGTNSGGDGSLLKPFRTIARALEVSSVGTYIIAMSGEYPLFNGKVNRFFVPLMDRTGSFDGRMCLEDLFLMPTTKYPNHNISDSSQWQLDYTGQSKIFFQEGFLTLSCDGTSPTVATSIFNFIPNSSDRTVFEVSAELRNSIDPVYFSVSNGPDNTATFRFNNGDYTCILFTAGEYFKSWGNIDGTSILDNQYFTDYICVSSEDVQNKYIHFTYNLGDATNIALNIIGGPPQHVGTDFYIYDSKIKWDGMNLDGEVKAGDVLRVHYMAEGVSGPVPVKFILRDNTITVMSRHEMLMKRTFHAPYTGEWKASFHLDIADRKETAGVHSYGYVSKFLAVAESFTETEKAKPYEYKVWHQPVIIHNN